MKTIKELVDMLNAVEPCEGFISMEFEDVTSRKARRIQLRESEFKKNFLAYHTEKFDHEQNKISVVVGGVTIFALEEKNV